MTEYAVEVIDLELPGRGWPAGKGWYVWEEAPRWSVLSSAEQWVDDVWQGSRMSEWPAHVQGMRVVRRDSEQDEWAPAEPRG